MVRKIKSKLSGQSILATPSKKTSEKVQARTNFYKSYKEETVDKVYDDIDCAIASYTQFLQDTDYDNALEFWRVHES